jgi:hypothetical protein
VFFNAEREVSLAGYSAAGYCGFIISDFFLASAAFLSA